MAQAMVTAKLEGGDKLARKLKRLGPAAAEVLGLACLVGGKVIASAANPLAPEPQIEVNLTEQTKRHATAEIGPPEDKWYWRFFETGAEAHEITGTPLAFETEGGVVVTGRVGHPGMVAEPFLRPAFDRQRKSAVNKMGAEFKDAVTK